MKRREVIALLGGTAVWPRVAMGQPSVPTVGFMHSLSPEATAPVLAAFRQGLAEAGYSEGGNVLVKYRWGRGRFDQLPLYAAELVALRVAVIAATGSTVSALAAKAATSVIPIVFTTGDDPLKVGLVERLNRPGGNITGVTAFATVTAAKRLGLLRELLPNAVTVALLHNPKSPVDAGETRDLEAAALALRLRLVVVEAGTETELEPAFASLASKGAQALITSTDPFFFNARSHGRARSALRDSDDLRFSGVPSGRGVDELWHQHCRSLSAGRYLHGQNPCWRQAWRSSRRSTHIL
jgi:putative ABC transport system substrate-binding protein